MDSKEQASYLEHRFDNEKRLRTYCLVAGITSVCVEFDGGGDSGQIESVTFMKDDEVVEPKEEILWWSMPAPVFDPEAKAWEHPGAEETSMDIVEAITEHVDAALNMSGIDWYNNDGGFGKWEWDVKHGLEFDINVRETTSECMHHETRELGCEEGDEPDDDDDEEDKP